MPSGEVLTAWAVPVAACVSLVALVVAGVQSLARQVELRRLRASLAGNWSNYLDTISVNIRQLKAFRTQLGRIYPSSEEAELSEIYRRVCATIAEEITLMEQELATLSVASDRQWYELGISWAPTRHYHREMQQLFDLAHQAMTPDRLEKLREEWTLEIERPFEQKIQELLREKQTLEERLAALEQELLELQNAKEEAERALLEALQNDLSQSAVRTDDSPEGTESASVSSQPRGYIEEEIAARYMGMLDDLLPLEQIEAKLAVADGQILYTRGQIGEAISEEERLAMEAKNAWAHQEKRWWEHMRKMARQRRLLDEALSAASGEGEEDDFEAQMQRVSEFQQMEARMSEMRQKIEQLTMDNRRLTQQLNAVNDDMLSVETYRKRFEDSEAARKGAERELRTLEKMVTQNDEEMEHLRLQIKKIDKLDLQLQEKEAAIKALQVKEAEMQTEIYRLKRDLEESNSQLDYEGKRSRKDSERIQEENEKMRSELKALQQKIASGSLDGLIPEQEMLDLQGAYDAVQSDLQKARAATKQAEYRLAEQIKHNQTHALKSGKELEELRQQVLSLRQSLHELKNSTVPESEVFELQAAYDSIKSELLRLKASVKKGEAGDVESAQEMDQLKLEYHELQKKHTELQAELQKRLADSIPKSRVAELQSAYELLGAKYQALRKTTGHPQTMPPSEIESGPKPAIPEDMVPAEEMVELQMAYDSLNVEVKKLQSRLREAEQKATEAASASEKWQGEYRELRQKIESHKRTSGGGDTIVGRVAEAGPGAEELERAKTESTAAHEETEIWKRRYKMLLDKHRSLRQEVDKKTDKLLTDSDPSLPQNAFDMPLSQ
jgi:chromosome segregation ATPase